MPQIALAQIDTILGDKESNLLKIERLFKEEASKNTDIICFPELATTGYSPKLLHTELWSLSENQVEEKLTSY